jgi:hypothetical protein
VGCSGVVDVDIANDDESMVPSPESHEHYESAAMRLPTTVVKHVEVAVVEEEKDAWTSS